MTDAPAPHVPRVVMFGADHAALALTLARAGCPVMLVEQDPHDRARLSDMLRRGGAEPPDGFGLAGEADVAGWDAVFASGPLPNGVTETGVPILSLDWTNVAETALSVSGLPGRQPLVECVGVDSACLVSRLGKMLGAQVVRMPSGVVPPSQRLLAVLSAEIEALVLTGATPADIDDALVAEGFALGPFEAQDLAGIDTCLAARRAVFARQPGPPELPLFARAVAEGRLGRKIGVGWYRYPGGGGKVEDPLVEDMAVEEARFAELPRVTLQAETIRSRVTAILNAEAERIVRDSGLARAEVDQIAQLAVGTPPGLTL